MNRNAKAVSRDLRAATEDSTAVRRRSKSGNGDSLPVTPVRRSAREELGAMREERGARSEKSGATLKV